MFWSVVAIVTLSCVEVINVVSGYPSGAPTSRCIDMTPGGPHPAGQTTASPYQITTSAIPGNYIPGETYSGELYQYVYKGYQNEHVHACTEQFEWNNCTNSSL